MAESDAVLRLDWMDASDAVDVARVLRELVERNAKACSEADTGPMFVEPILRGLGWDTLGEDVAREGPGRGPLGDTYLYWKDRKMAVVIEMKALQNYKGKLQRKDFTGQLAPNVRRLAAPETLEPWRREQRLVRAGDDDGRVFAYAVLTNGRCWKIYDFSAGRTAHYEDPLLDFDLLNADKAKWRELYSRLSKKAVYAEVQGFLGE